MRSFEKWVGSQSSFLFDGPRGTVVDPDASVCLLFLNGFFKLEGRMLVPEAAERDSESVLTWSAKCDFFQSAPEATVEKET